jgi:hypothetical protein
MLYLFMYLKICFYLPMHFMLSLFWQVNVCLPILVKKLDGDKVFIDHVFSNLFIK